MSYYIEEEATRINKEIDNLKPLIEKYLAERLQKTIDKFNLTYAWLGNYGCGDEYEIDLEPSDGPLFSEAHEYFHDSLAENVLRFLKYVELEITIGEQ